MDKAHDVKNAKIEEDIGPSNFVSVVRSGNAQDVRRLLENGADPNAKDDAGYSPLSWACFWNHFEIVQLLLENRADPNAKDRSKCSSFSMACCRGHFGLVQLLLENGADLNLESSNGATSLYWLCHKGHFDIGQWMLQHKILVPQDIADQFPEMKIYREIQQTKLLLCLIRKFRPDSIWSEDNLPLDMFRLILKEYTLHPQIKN